MKIETIQKQHSIKMSEAKIGDVIIPQGYPKNDYYLKIYMDIDLYSLNQDYVDLDLKDAIPTISLSSGKVTLFLPDDDCTVYNAKIVIEKDV